MKIIHTADWHIGKKLHDFDLQEDFDQFITWLVAFIAAEKADVLLISGDIFDLANPSSTARNQYYRSLVELKKVVPKIILTGGNHDSPSVLNAPRELLKALDFEVIGGLPEQIKEILIPLKNKENKVEIVVAAIPFLRNSDLHYPTVIKTYEERLEALKNGIKEVFDGAAIACQECYPDTPALAMGHLFAAGVETSDGERDIQIGNQAAVDSSAFGQYFNYVALGHIHKPQRVSAAQPVFYSGSPIPLSFSERKDKKRILLIDTDKGWEPQSISIPSFRKLIKIKGDLRHIQRKLSELPEHQGLSNLIEIEFIGETYQDKLLQDLEHLIAVFSKSGYEIVKHRVRFINQQKQTGEIFEETVSLAELEPEKVFEERLAQEDYSLEDKKEIEVAFRELLEEAQNRIEE